MNNTTLKKVFIALISFIGIFIGYTVVENKNTEIENTYKVNTIDSLTQDSTFFQLPDSLNKE